MNDERRTSAARGIMLVLSSPSGAGKTTLTRNLLEQENNDYPGRLALSVSVTTRPRRPSEIDGVHYHFTHPAPVRADARQRRIAGMGRGPRQFLRHAARAGRGALTRASDVLFDIDWQGTQQLLEKMRDDVVSVFVLPPSARRVEVAAGAARRGQRRGHRAAAAQRGRGISPLERIRLRPGQSRSRQELRAAAFDPDRGAA